MSTSPAHQVPARTFLHPVAAAKRFEVDGRTYSLTEMVEANASDDDLCEWLGYADVGDFYPSFVSCQRVA